MLLVRIFPSLLQDEGAEWPGEEREALRRARTGNKDRCWRHGMCGCTVGDNIGEIRFVFHSDNLHVERFTFFSGEVRIFLTPWVRETASLASVLDTCMPIREERSARRRPRETTHSE